MQPVALRVQLALRLCRVLDFAESIADSLEFSPRFLHQKQRLGQVAGVDCLDDFIGQGGEVAGAEARDLASTSVLETDLKG